MEEWLYHKFYEIEKAHWWFAARERIVLHLARRAAGLQPGGRVLDIGCGTGGVLQAFSLEHDAWGIDSSPLALELCRKRGLEKVRLLDALPETAGPFDLVLLLDVIEHIDDDAGVLANAGKRLAPGGRVLVTVPAFPWLWSEHDTANHHKRRYTRAELERKFAAANLEPERISYYNTLLFPLALADRALSRFRPGKPDAGLALPPRPVNAALREIFALERFWLRHFSFPFGLSLAAIARPLAP